MTVVCYFFFNKDTFVFSMIISNVFHSSEKKKIIGAKIVYSFKMMNININN